jgi:hypothetical protein
LGDFRLEFIARKGGAVYSALHHEARNTLDLLSRAQQLFGGQTRPADPPAFVAPPDLEDDLGEGWF